jgi:hypothetical protein
MAISVCKLAFDDGPGCLSKDLEIPVPQRFNETGATNVQSLKEHWWTQAQASVNAESESRGQMMIESVFLSCMRYMILVVTHFSVFHFLSVNHPSPLVAATNRTRAPSRSQKGKFVVFEEFTAIRQSTP